MEAARTTGEEPSTVKRPWMRWVFWIMLTAIVLGGAGFIYKLAQFSKEALANHDGSFAVVPIVVYVFVALGFVCLFLWALLRGQFRNIEAPKRRLLEQEEIYDREDI